MMPSGPHSSTIGTGDAVIVSTVVRRLWGQAVIGPMPVEAQSNASISAFASWGGIGEDVSGCKVCSLSWERFIFGCRRAPHPGVGPWRCSVCPTLELCRTARRSLDGFASEDKNGNGQSSLLGGGVFGGRI